jgi:hypothetical protein
MSNQLKIFSSNGSTVRYRRDYTHSLQPRDNWKLPLKSRIPVAPIRDRGDVFKQWKSGKGE